MNLISRTINKRIAIVMLAAFMMVNYSCEEILQVDPRQSIDFDIALQTRGGLTAAINSVYARLRNARTYGRDMIEIPEALADNGRATNNSGRLIGEYNNNQGAHFTGTLWQNGYSAINEINLILEAIPILNEAGVTQADRDGWTGEMKFLRALYHFDIARVYGYDPGVAVASRDKGSIPVSTVAIRTADAAFAYLPSRPPVADVYTQIYADLDDAIAKILPTATSRYKANLAAAHALYSRVALYNKDYAKAVSEATAALAGGIGLLVSGNAYVTGWRAELNPESMFEVRFAIATENIGVNESVQTSQTTIPNFTVIGTSTQLTSVGGWGDLVPSVDLLAQLQLSTTGSGASTVIVRSGTDTRGFLFEVGNGRGSGPKIECIKYMGKSGQQNLDNVPLLRISEMYLNRAEAYMSQAVPDEVLALADLNSILVARGLAPSALTGTALYDEILRQRRIEFAFEGQRWFDLKRRGVNIVKLPATVNYDDTRILAAIPQREVDGNPNLVQNDGY